MGHNGNPNSLANLKTVQPGERLDGRKKGTPNKLTLERVEREIRRCSSASGG
jgi:hypothetical protein